MNHPLSDLAKGLARQDRDTYIIGTIIICTFLSLIARVPAVTAIVAGCLFLGLYVLARLLLMLLKVHELKLTLRKEVGSEAERILLTHATPEERAELEKITPVKPPHRVRKKANDPDAR